MIHFKLLFTCFSTIFILCFTHGVNLESIYSFQQLRLNSIHRPSNARCFTSLLTHTHITPSTLKYGAECFSPPFFRDLYTKIIFALWLKNDTCTKINVIFNQNYATCSTSVAHRLPNLDIWWVKTRFDLFASKVD